jgi:glycine/D-amino acid oxidase-like deaminating enzyme
MAPPPEQLDGDLAVDVLIIGAGIQGLYLARELSRTYSVCVVADPAMASATLESDGYLSAGYDGNDVNRIQPARRAAAWWRLWAESNEVPFERGPTWFVLPPDELSSRTRMWSDAALAATQVDQLPPVFGAGSLSDHVPFHTDTDVVINPARLLTELRKGIAGRCLEGEVVRFGLFTDEAIDDVQVQVGEVLVPIVARFVVLAAGVGNADLLTKLSSRFSDQARRKSSKVLVDGCQAVRSQYQLCLRGDLPAVSGHVGSFTVASHATGPPDRRTWVVSPPVDDALTTLGPTNTRFDPPIDAATVAGYVEELLAASPALAEQAGELEWAVYVTRRAEHPSLAVADASIVAQPVPAKLEKLDLEGFLAVWPSHLAYAQFVGDSVAERIGEALGPPGSFPDSLDPADLGSAVPELVARWERADFPWRDWTRFRQDYGLTRY